MRYVKWTFLAVIAIAIFLFFNYTLPDRDVVRIVETEVRRVDFGENSVFWAQPDVGAGASGGSRDVRLIPYFNIGLIVVLLGVVFWLWRVWDRFRQARIEPIVDNITIAIDNADERADNFRERLLSRFRKKK